MPLTIVVFRFRRHFWTIALTSLAGPYLACASNDEPRGAASAPHDAAANPPTCATDHPCRGDGGVMHDAGILPDDASLPDAGFDASPWDAHVDADSPPDAAPSVEAGLPLSPPVEQLVAELPELGNGAEFYLSQTGLYVDTQTKQLSGDVLRFEPNYRLWSDGAAKERFLRLPSGQTIDTSDMGSWSFPVGTMFFKQFSRDGVRVETRLIARTGPGERDYWMGAFIWNDDESDARLAEAGAENARGTAHDVPSTTQCGTCHNGERGRALGVSAVQLAGAVPLALDDLVNLGRISHPPPSSLDLSVPGDAVTAAALGYLHANCGHCHNPSGSARPDTDLNLRLPAGEQNPEQTPTYLTTIGVPLQNFQNPELSLRVVAEDPGQSALWFRMHERGTSTQMPPLATELVDPDGVETIKRWIESL